MGTSVKFLESMLKGIRHGSVCLYSGLGRQRQADHWDLLASQPSLLSEPQASVRLHLKKQGE